MINESNFRVTTIGDINLVGDNTSTAKNGLFDFSKLGKTLFIPGTIQGKTIHEIAQYSFFSCTILEEVIIGENIRQIGEKAFSRTPNLIRFKFPSTIEYLCYLTIHTYNSSGTSIVVKDNYTARGTLTVEFAPNSRLEVFSHHAIIRKEHIRIYYWGKKSPAAVKDPFFKGYYKTVKIYAPYIKTFVGFPTIQIQSCRQNRRSSTLCVHFMILISKS